MEKSCPEREGHPPSQVNFSSYLCEKKVDNSTITCPDSLTLTELTQLSEPKCSYGEKLVTLGG